MTRRYALRMVTVSSIVVHILTWCTTDWYTYRDQSGVWPHTKPKFLCSHLVMCSPKLDSKEPDTQIQDVLNYISLFKVGGSGKQENLKVRRKTCFFFFFPLTQTAKCDFSLYKRQLGWCPRFPTGLEFPLSTHSGARLVESELFSEAWSPSAFLWGSSVSQPAANSQEQQALPCLPPLSTEERPETRPAHLSHLLCSTASHTPLPEL